MLIKVWGLIYYAWKNVGVQLIRRQQRCDNDKLRSLILQLWEVWQKKVVQKFRLSLEEKNESNSKLLKDKILQVNNFLLLNFVFFSHRERVISKHLTLFLAYVSITNNLKVTTTFLIMKSIIRKFQILIHNNKFTLGILF